MNRPASWCPILLCLCALSLAAAQKPNVVVFVADDMGFADCGVYGCKDIPTPNIDSLAKNGVRFTHAYTSGCVCSPTRAGLMTGRYQQRFGFDANNETPRWIDPRWDGNGPRPNTTRTKKSAAGKAKGREN